MIVILDVFDGTDFCKIPAATGSLVFNDKLTIGINVRDA